MGRVERKNRDEYIEDLLVILRAQVKLEIMNLWHINLHICVQFCSSNKHQFRKHRLEEIL